MIKTKHFQTIAIHGGGKEKNPENALNPPIFMTSTFTFDSLEHVQKVMTFESDDYVYTRGNNPTLRLLEERMALLENGIASVAFASGMAAISSVLLSLTKPCDTILAHKTLYGSSYNVLANLLPKYNINCILADLSKDDWKDKLQKNVKVIYFETPANPNLTIIDIAKISQLAHENGSKVVIDNTFATPFFQKPLDFGADVVVHSATKYLNGHGDALGGIAVAKDLDYIHKLKFDYMCELGGVMSPFNGWLLLRGIKTLALRMKHHEKNAQALAEYLEPHAQVKSVLFPGLKNFPGHELANKQMTGFGAMLSFEVVGGLQRAAEVVSKLRMAKLAVSLGDCETLVEFPAEMTHRGYRAHELAEFGLTESMLRVSVGLEDAADIIADFDEALS
jgi:methionine-gamma-lyase